MDYHALWAWSVADVPGFWRQIWEHFDILADPGTGPGYVGDKVFGGRWFPSARLNYVDQVFRNGPSDGIALVALAENGFSEELTWSALREQVGSLAATLREIGVKMGDRVVGYLPNGSEAVVAFLATASLGAIWSACGMEYAPSAALSRFAQLAPVVLFVADGYQSSGTRHDRVGFAHEVRGGLPTVRATIWVDRLGSSRVEGDRLWSEVISTGTKLSTRAVPFDHPLWVLFSSGTTGTPKGIVHGHGGVLLEHLKALALHLDVGPHDRYWWYTSVSWMMWNFQVSGLLVGATIVCYDGSPSYPSLSQLWALAERHQVSVLGTSPPHLTACLAAGFEPQSSHDLSRLHTLGVTGSPLAPAGYRWVRDAVGRQVRLAGLSGGTDIVTALAGSAPTLPVWAGELSAPCLGVALDAFDETGSPVRDQVGELVVTKPMPSMPIGFWDDPGNTRYYAAYFNFYPGIWRQGDWVTVTSRGSVIVHGRSDATLNRNGIRMGSGEIYAAVEAVPGVLDALVVGIDEPDGGYWMPLFVVLETGLVLDDLLTTAIRQSVRDTVSPRHVPDEVIHAAEIPRTRTGKKLEIPVKKLLLGSLPPDSFGADTFDDPLLPYWYADIGARHRASTPRRPIRPPT